MDFEGICNSNSNMLIFSNILHCIIAISTNYEQAYDH